MEKIHRTSPRSRNRKLQVLALALPLTLLAFTGFAAAGPLLDDLTPTVAMFLPLVVRMTTPTATFTPVPSPTPVTPVPPTGSKSVSGALTREDPNKPTYATRCEDVWFYELIHNDDGARALNWGILGVNVQGPNTNVFHTSWSAPNEPGQMFTLYPNCYGPLGMPCAGSIDGAKHRDAIGGYRPDSRLINPGTYTLSMAICLSPYNVCPSSGGWRVLSSVSIVAVDWYDPSCNRTLAQAVPTPNSDPLAGCHLDLSDPQHAHMVCPGK
jgi:hypothetical protein